MRNTRLSRVAAALTALAAVAAVAVVGSNVAQAAPPAPGQSLSVTSGTETTSFTLNLATGNNFCPGDATTAGGGWRWHQYIVNADLDVETVTFGTLGPALPAGAPAGSVAQNLYSTTGSAQAARSTLAAGTGQITGATTLNFVQNVGIGLPAGRYKIGFVCTQAGVVGRYWESRISVVSTGAGTISWQQGWPPAAPTGVTANGADQSITGSFSPVTADPAVTGYTVSATPVGGGAATTVNVPAAGPYTFTIPGLVNGTQYGVTVTASNSVGTGPASSPAVLATPALPPVGAPVVSTVTGTGQFTVNWTPAAVPGGATLVSHTVTVSPTVAGSPFTVPAGTNTLVVTAAPGTYSVTVQAVYAAPFVGTASAPASATSTAAFVGPVIQEVIVERPAGALVLTQRCGVSGSAPAFTDNTFGPLPALPASPASADPTNANPLLGWLFTNPVGPGSAPSVVAGTDANGFPTLGALDTPNFGEYPYPVDANEVPNPVYPTHCGINLGNARLLTSGEFAGVYFAATGRINQLSVVDTRDLDEGWTLNGRMGTFRSEDDLSDTFHGNLMGWDPEVTWDSAGSFDGYNMVVAAGPSKNPRAEATADGLRDVPLDNELLSRSLAQANPGQGLGIAVMDARLRLLIPVTADAGTYRGTLTFTVV